MSHFTTLRHLLDARRPLRRDLPAALKQQNRRFQKLLQYTRANSPYYQQRYRGLQSEITDVTLLDKKYLVSTTSGSSGVLGIFLHDARVRHLNAALSLREITTWLSANEILKLSLMRHRTAIILATNGHHVAYGGLVLTKQHKTKSRIILPVTSSLKTICKQLETFQPGILLGYANTVAMLAEEQHCGRLNISPLLTILTAEGLEKKNQQNISDQLNTRVINKYCASEALSLAVPCRHGWNHINSDWHIFEPVDKNMNPVPPGVYSHTTLLTNLSNFTQPFIRYDLGDSVLQRDTPCPCGNTMPAFKIKGRSAEQLTCLANDGTLRELVPRQVTTILAHSEGILQFQLIQTSQQAFQIKTIFRKEIDWHSSTAKIGAELRHQLDSLGFSNVTINFDCEPPIQGESGKYKRVIPLKNQEII